AAAIACANGGSISFGHVPLPSGALKGGVPKPIVEAFREANTFIREREQWLLHAESVPDAAVLHSIQNRRMIEASSLANHVEASLSGVNRMLIEGNIHFDVLSDRDLPAFIGRGYKLLVLPD